MIHIDSKIFLSLMNEVTEVHNHMVKGNQFRAGFMLAFHQQHLLDLMKESEQQERNYRADSTKSANTRHNSEGPCNCTFCDRLRT